MSTLEWVIMIAIWVIGTMAIAIFAYMLGRMEERKVFSDNIEGYDDIVEWHKWQERKRKLKVLRGGKKDENNR